MNIKEVLAKVGSGEELTDEEKAFIGSYEEPNLDAVSNAKGKKERLKLQKKIDDMQAALDEKEVEIEEASAGSSDLESLQKQIDKLNGKQETTLADLTAEREGHAQTKRSNALKGVKVDWMADVPMEYRDMVLGTAFDGIDTEDLGDVAVTKSIIDSITETQARFISSGQKGGAGTGVGEDGKSLSTGKKWTRESIVAAQKDGTYAANRAEIMAEASAGNIE
jgi:hypothetical protein